MQEVRQAHAPLPLERVEALPIRRSLNGVCRTRPQPGRDHPEWVVANQSERMVAINRNRWSQSAGAPTQRVGQSAGWYKSFPRIDRLAAIFRLDIPPARSRSTSRILRTGNLCPGIVTNTRSRTAIKRQTHADIADLDWRRLEHPLLHVIELAPSRDRICNCANSQ
jgi:hypothetical protein